MPGPGALRPLPTGDGRACKRSMTGTLNSTSRPGRIGGDRGGRASVGTVGRRGADGDGFGRPRAPGRTESTRNSTCSFAAAISRPWSLCRWLVLPSRASRPGGLPGLFESGRRRRCSRRRRARRARRPRFRPSRPPTSPPLPGAPDAGLTASAARRGRRLPLRGPRGSFTPPVSATTPLPTDPGRACMHALPQQRGGRGVGAGVTERPVPSRERGGGGSAPWSPAEAGRGASAGHVCERQAGPGGVARVGGR